MQSTSASKLSELPISHGEPRVAVGNRFQEPQMDEMEIEEMWEGIKSTVQPAACEHARGGTESKWSTQEIVNFAEERRQAKGRGDDGQLIILIPHCVFHVHMRTDKTIVTCQELFNSVRRQHIQQHMLLQ